MALSKKALQRKREKKKTKRQMKVAKLFSSNPVNYSHWPVYECWVPIELWDTGVGSVIIARKNNQGEIAAGIYLLDVFCLGIKNCFVRLTDFGGYQAMLAHIEAACGELQPVEATYAYTLIHKAETYATECGFKPHVDFGKAKNLLKNIAIDEGLEFTFGKGGKPYYVQGPNESFADIKRILQTLELNKGTGNYHYTLEIPDPNLLAAI